jgi:Ferric reductase NAD binding domain
VSGPYGNCSVIPDMTDELVLVGGGVGVTPMISAFSDYLYKDLAVVDAGVITSEPISKVCICVCTRLAIHLCSVRCVGHV